MLTTMLTISSNHVHTHAINVEHISNAITHLKSEKSDNFEGLTSDNFRLPNWCCLHSP